MDKLDDQPPGQIGDIRPTNRCYPGQAYADRSGGDSAPAPADFRSRSYFFIGMGFGLLGGLSGGIFWREVFGLVWRLFGS